MAPIALALALGSQLGCGLAQSAAKGAAQGAVGTLAGKVGDRENVLRMTDEIKRRVAGGMMDELSEPGRLAQLQRIAASMAAGGVHGASRAALGAAPVDALIDATAEQAARAFSRQMVAELGRTGDGPLSVSLSAASEQVTGSIARGARGELAPLFPECSGADASQCLDRAVERLSRATSAGVAEGLRGSLGGWPLAFAFGAGALIATAIGWAWRVARTRPPGRPARPAR